MKLKTVRNFLILLIILFVTFGFGFRLGETNSKGASSINLSQISGKSPTIQIGADFSLFWDIWDKLNRLYIDKAALVPQKMVYGAISGMVAAVGDPYTVFLPPEQNKEAKDDLSGKFEGIGAQLGIKDKKIVVVAPLKKSPAEKAGIKPGDWIAKVDGKETLTWTLPETIAKIRGPKGTSVTLTIVHKEAVVPQDVKVNRDTIAVAAVEWETKKYKMINSKIQISEANCSDCQQAVYLKLSRFGDQTNTEWVKAVNEIRQQISQSGSGIKGLVFDLRNNPGGYLSGSIFIGSEFIKEGVVVTQDSVIQGSKTYMVERKGQLLDIPMVVLINKGSASASEIVAGTLQEHKRAKIVGETSFGKGSVQEAQDLPGGAGIHITTAKWLLPSGKWINSVGVEPDFKVSLDENSPDNDLQLQKALELLN